MLFYRQAHQSPQSMDPRHKPNHPETDILTAERERFTSEVRLISQTDGSERVEHPG